jgi:hypothetical protein
MQLRDDGDVNALPLRLDRSAHTGKTSTEDNHIVSNHQEPPKAVHGDAARESRVRVVADARKDVTGVTMKGFPAIDTLFAPFSNAAESRG